MKRFFFLLIFLNIFLILNSQVTWKEYNWKKTKSGLEYHIIKKGKGKKIKTNNLVKLHFIWFSSKTGEKLGDTYADNTPQTWKSYSGIYVKGFEEAILLLKKGGKGYFKIPSYLAYGVMGIQGEPTLCYYIEVVSIIDYNIKK